MAKVYVVNTASGLRARKSPNGDVVKYKSGKLKGKTVIRPQGFKIKVLETKKVGNKTWGRGEHFWYCLDYCRPYKKPTTGSRPASPVPGYGVNYAFGVRNSGYAAGFHTGEDHAAPTGTPIVAVISGTIIRADNGGAYGNWTLLKGKDQNGNVRTYLYAHQSRRTVRAGQKVKRGQVIGYVGSTGNVTGPHLHFEKSSGENWAYARVVRPSW